MTEKFRTRKEASAYISERGLRCAPTTLQKYASIGGGPRYRRFGNRAVYLESDLDAWIEERLSGPLASTSNASLEDGGAVSA